MGKALRVSVTMFASLALVAGLAACGDDDESAEATTTTTTTVAGDEGEGEGEGEEGGAPDVNPCAEGESGTFGPPSEPPSDDATEVTIVGSEYNFAGFEEMSSAGEYAMTFTNEGEELHEAVIMKIDDEETRPIEELLELPEEEAMEVTSQVAFAFACPGDTAEPVSVDLSEPGRYVALCFIPVGTVPETDPEDFETMGPPHFVQGMVHEFEVS
jgi:hypothetical protein